MKLSGQMHDILLTGGEDTRLKTLKAVKGRIIENNGPRCVVMPLEMVGEWERLQESHQLRLIAQGFILEDVQRVMPRGYILNDRWVLAEVSRFLGIAQLAIWVFDLEEIDLAKFAYSFVQKIDYCLHNGERPMVLDFSPYIAWSVIDEFIRGIFDATGEWEFFPDDLFGWQSQLAVKMKEYTTQKPAHENTNQTR